MDGWRSPVNDHLRAAYGSSDRRCGLRWDQIDFNGAVLHVRRVKNARCAAC
jgi:hypothetical protein